MFFDSLFILSVNLLHQPLSFLEVISDYQAFLVQQEFGLKTLEDLLSFYPFRYADRSIFYKVAQLCATQMQVQMVGKITSLKTIPQKRGGSRLVAIFTDDTGQMELIWFNGAQWIQKRITIGKMFVIYGKVTSFAGRWSMSHPDIELWENFKQKEIFAGLSPIYPSTEKLTRKKIGNRFFQKSIEEILKKYSGHIVENLSQDILQTVQLFSKKQALYKIHFPKNAQELQEAQRRLKFEELFFIQLQLIKHKITRQQQIKGHRFETVGNYFNTYFTTKLPFELTGAQKKVLREIRADLKKNVQMNRLLQGDVGSGKTIVALLTMLLALDNDFQAALVAPTEILAQQHFESLQKDLRPMGIDIALFTGSTKTALRKALLARLQSGSLQILIGTHALFEDTVRFKKLGLVVIDEQHRFGVAQRSKMWLKNDIPPHVLVMTATPIPRTLAMTVYGDLEVSVIDELPMGRKPIKTFHRTDKHRLSIFRFLKDEIAKGRQVYVVYPLIQESEKMDYKDLMDGYESLAREFPLPNYAISIVHGQMKAEDKAYEMERFVKGETQIMVATTVIEVGVNVPNASVMVIESAERFGLAQLHQLRGRVGRGAAQSYCILMTGHKLSDEGKIRMQTMVSTTDGFEIASVDLKLRGPGNLMGTQQSGALPLKIADLVKDTPILEQARDIAHTVLQNDPDLSSEKNKGVLNYYQWSVRHQKLWKYIS